jgi:hypothetical protein
MASQLGFSEFMSNNENMDKEPRKRKNKTIKKKTKPSKKAMEFLNSMSGYKNEDDDDEGLADFNPPPNPELTSLPNEKVEENVDAALSPEAFNNINVSDEKIKQYYDNYIPYYENTTNVPNIHGSKDDLMKKLNYMIHLLEENKDEKTNNVTEELILYMFLGVFVIFVVDSFAKAGKYTR